jgi:hypothetical protein
MKQVESAVNNYPRSADAAERDAQNALDTVHKTDTCRRRRRKKRFLSSFLCDMFGGKGIQNAHERLNLAVHNKHLVKHRLHSQQQILNKERSRHQAAKSQLNATTAQLRTLQSKLKQMQISFKNMAMFAKEFKGVEIYLKEVLSSQLI